MKLTPVADQTVVITGASSGIGLATALAFAARGARLVLVSRDETDLAEAEERVRGAGASDVISVAADTADRLGLDYVVQQAAARFGGFDTWINNAAGAMYGPITEVPIEDARQLFETNYWGMVNGSLVAVEHFKRRGGETAGHLINIGSVVSDRAIPLQGHYSASKHAVKGFTDALRMELEKEGAPVYVTLIKPGSIATPYPEHAANYMDEAPTLPPPVYAPEVVARAVVAVAGKPRRDLVVGGGGRMISAMGLFPRLADRYMEATLFDQQTRDDRPARRGPRSLQEPVPNEGANVRGDVDRRVRTSSLYTQAALHPFVTAGAALAVGLGLAAALRK